MADPYRTVLVVDDDETTLKAFSRCAADRTVLTARSGAAALEISRDRRPDLVILDLRLEHESGLDVLRALKALDATITVVVVSGYPSVSDAVGLVKEGASTVLVKPVTLVEVISHLDGPSCVHLSTETPTLARAEWEHMMRVLHDCNGNITEAAKRLGIERSTLQRKLRKNPPRQ